MNNTSLSETFKRSTVIFDVWASKMPKCNDLPILSKTALFLQKIQAQYAEKLFFGSPDLLLSL